MQMCSPCAPLKCALAGGQPWPRPPRAGSLAHPGGHVGFLLPSVQRKQGPRERGAEKGGGQAKLGADCKCLSPHGSGTGAARPAQWSPRAPQSCRHAWGMGTGAQVTSGLLWGSSRRRELPSLFRGQGHHQGPTGQGWCGGPSAHPTCLPAHPADLSEGPCCSGAKSPGRQLGKHRACWPHPLPASGAAGRC